MMSSQLLDSGFGTRKMRALNGYRFGRGVLLQEAVSL